MRTVPLLLLLACSATAAYAEQFTGKVIVVIDGDTVMVTRKGGPPVKVRLAEIDAPEKSQPGGMASKTSLSGMVLHKQVSVNSQAVDQYGRLVAHLDVNGLDVNAEQIRRGMAWEYSMFHRNLALKALQQQARQAHRGLWAENSPTPPWIWRKQHPEAMPSGLRANMRHTQTDPRCGNKRRCSEMSSCEEARFYFERCGVKSLDGDGDGTPCERLCAAQNTRN
jgi:endonuclease YncB( thermonuclease family)